MTSLENILLYYNTLEFGSVPHTVLRHCLTHLHELPNMTIYQLAEACYTSPSTLSRLVKTLGFKNFSTFQHAIQDCVNRYYFHNRLVPPQPFGYGFKTDGLGQSMVVPGDMYSFLKDIDRMVSFARKLADGDQFKRIAEMMHSASKVVIFPYGFFLYELFLQSDLFLSQIACDIVNGDSHHLKAARDFSENSVALILSPECIDGYYTTEAVVREIKQRGGKICFVSASTRTPFLHLADIAVSFEGSRHGVDALFMEIFMGILTIQYRQMYLDEQLK